MSAKDYIACGLILLGLMFSMELTSAEGGETLATFSADNVVVSSVTTGSQESISKALSLENKPAIEAAPLAGSVVPEPTTIALLGLGGVALMAKRNRRRQAV